VRKDVEMGGELNCSHNMNTTYLNTSGRKNGIIE
jgi:hypothetical protein